jgi:hypothetical protein
MMDIEKLLRRAGGIIKLQGREYVTYRGLLFVAHQSGLESVDVKLINWDAESKMAIVAATVKGERGSFSDIGDASPQNVNRMIASATIRMASTRAQARALRSYLGVGFTSLEELPGDQKSKPQPEPKPHRKPQIKDEQFNYAAAAEWALTQGAFTSVEEALDAQREVFDSSMTNAEMRRAWRTEVEALTKP